MTDVSIDPKIKFLTNCLPQKPRKHHKQLDELIHGLKKPNKTVIKSEINPKL
jgi:hypothetical protein